MHWLGIKGSLAQSCQPMTAPKASESETAENIHQAAIQRECNDEAHSPCYLASLELQLASRRVDCLAVKNGIARPSDAVDDGMSSQIEFDKKDHHRSRVPARATLSLDAVLRRLGR